MVLVNSGYRTCVHAVYSEDQFVLRPFESQFPQHKFRMDVWNNEFVVFSAIQTNSYQQLEIVEHRNPQLGDSPLKDHFPLGKRYWNWRFPDQPPRVDVLNIDRVRHGEFPSVACTSDGTPRRLGDNPRDGDRVEAPPLADSIDVARIRTIKPEFWKHEDLSSLLRGFPILQPPNLHEKAHTPCRRCLLPLPPGSEYTFLP